MIVPMLMFSIRLLQKVESMKFSTTGPVWPAWIPQNMDSSLDCQNIEKVSMIVWMIVILLKNFPSNVSHINIL